MKDMQVLDISGLANKKPNDVLDQELVEVCKLVAQSLRSTGCAIVKHTPVETTDNEAFLDMMEQYFAQPHEVKMQDVRAECHYQVGATPSYVETPRILLDEAMQQSVVGLQDQDRPTMPQGPDAKWRYFWRVGERPESSEFAELNAAPVVPKAFPQWTSVMDAWGSWMLDVAHTVAHATAVGLGLPPDSLSSLMHQGPHLLAPTGSDLSGDLACLGNVFAGYHYDLNFLTLHGRSRFPGLFLWLRDGRRVPVQIPPGCLLVQAGKQLEWLTGGDILAGMHEVVVTSDTLRAVEEARAAGRSLWRTSSTVFSHVASSKVLQPLGHLASPEALAKYPPTLAGAQVQAELAAIKLKRKAVQQQPAAPVPAAAAAAAGLSAEAEGDESGTVSVVAVPATGSCRVVRKGDAHDVVCISNGDADASGTSAAPAAAAVGC